MLERIKEAIVEWNLARRTEQTESVAVEQMIDVLLYDLRTELLKDPGFFQRNGLTMFRPLPDLITYRRAVVAILEADNTRAYRQGKTDGLATVSGRACMCRCRTHRRGACQRCNTTNVCPVHSDADPSTIMPEVMFDPESMARLLYATIAEVNPELLFAPPIPTAWEHLDEDEHRDWIEVAARAVCSRLRRPTDEKANPTTDNADSSHRSGIE